LAFLYPAIYLIVFITIFENTHPSLVTAILSLHFFAMFCLFYNLYFVSESLLLVERQRQVSFHDYAGSFFLLWFFPIGVWFIGAVDESALRRTKTQGH